MDLSTVREQIVSCERCPRLRTYCARIAREKKAAHRNDEYWGRPVPGFGDPQARLLILGLAPAAHGANRTGRVFTGDGSGDFLMRALHRAGFANIPTSRHADDGLELDDAYIAAAVRCAPPDNKPTPEELRTCQLHLEAEIGALPRLQVVVALGKIAFDAWWRVMAACDVSLTPRPSFGHGARYAVKSLPALTRMSSVRRQADRPQVRLKPDATGRGIVKSAAGTRTNPGMSVSTLARAPCRGSHVRVVIASYHPSRQNTNTGKLTPAMLESVFRKARRLLSKLTTEATEM